jgi:hypothetical protein
MAIYSAEEAARTHREYGDFTARAVIYGATPGRRFHAAANRRLTASTVFCGPSAVSLLTSAARRPLNMEDSPCQWRFMVSR